MNSVSLRISGCSACAIIDQEDYQAISSYAWESRNGYASRRARKDGTRKTLYMHRVIAGAKHGEIVDHINRNKLDNRKANLRVATPSQNNANQAGRRAHKGAYKNAKGKTWSAKIAGKHIGNFPSEQDAALAYDKAARLAYGTFAKTNFPDIGVS